MAQSISNLAIGSKVKLGKLHNADITWLIADRNYAGYPNNSVTLVSEQIIKLMPFDAKESAGSDTERDTYGNNCYVTSNIRQWLNSAASAGAWYTAQHPLDQPPSAANVYINANAYDTSAGFLNGFSATERAALLDTTLTAVTSSVDSGVSRSFTDKVFLLSASELGILSGTPLSQFSTTTSRKATVSAAGIANSNYSGTPTAGTSWYYWTRDADSTSEYKVTRCNNYGTNDSSQAYLGSIGLRPACNLSNVLLVSDSSDADGCYTIIYNNASTTPGTPKQTNTATEGQAWTNTWTASYDPEGDSITYVPEWRMDGDGFVALPSTSEPQATVQIPAAIRPGDSIPISWTAGEGAESYAIQRKINDGAWTDLVKGITRTNYTDTAPSSAKRFTQVHYRVASETDGSVATDYTEAGKPVYVYVQGGEE